MKKEIIISSAADDVRIAITEDKRLAELFLETPDTHRMVGDIYLGKVMKVIPGMNAAFIDVGHKQDAFLHFSDIASDSIDEYSNWFDGEDEIDTEDDDDDEEEESSYGGHRSAASNRENSAPVQAGNPVQTAETPARPRIRRRFDEQTGQWIVEEVPAEPAPAPQNPQQNRGHENGHNNGHANNGHSNGRGNDRGGDRRGGRNDRGRRPMPDRKVNIQKGQNIIVQVTREPVGKKGVRVTTRVSLPGRFLVLIPFEGRVGVSRKVQSIRERKRLRRLVRSMLPEGFGAIIRTVAENKDEALIKQDLQSLLDTYKEIEQKAKTENPPTVLFKESSISTSVIRDLFTREVERVIIDNKKLYKEISRYISWAAPGFVDKVKLYEESVPVFDKYGIEREIETTMSRKVYLPSGGYIIIEHTEAMVVVDVNSGKCASKADQELNSLRSNMEAAREIARQVRLRDLGGIIVIDFIDVHDDRNKKKIYDEVRKEFRRDRAKSTILQLSDFGLMQITRQRMRQTILHSVSEPCPACGGTGMVQSKHTIMSRIEGWMRRVKTNSKERKLILSVHPFMVDYLNEGFIKRITRLKWKFGLSIKLQPDDTLSVDEYKVFSVKTQKDITEQYK